MKYSELLLQLVSYQSEQYLRTKLHPSDELAVRHNPAELRTTSQLLPIRREIRLLAGADWRRLGQGGKLAENFPDHGSEVPLAADLMCQPCVCPCTYRIDDGLPTDPKPVISGSDAHSFSDLDSSLGKLVSSAPSRIAVGAKSTPLNVFLGPNIQESAKQANVSEIEFRRPIVISSSPKRTDCPK